MDYHDIVFANNTLVIVGENGSVLVGVNPYDISERDTNITESLNNVTYVESLNEWTIVGDNNTILQTNNILAIPVVWNNSELFREAQPNYSVIGDPFLSGYGPEEMVPGLVQDQLTMIVNTRPGTTWAATEYAHVGYRTASVQLERDVENLYSFKNVAQTPALIDVYKSNDGTSTRLYNDIDYTINWATKEVSLTVPLTVGQELLICVYEVGNGDQLVESSSNEDIVNTNLITGFNEVNLDCKYAGQLFEGNGIINPNTLTLFTDPAIFKNGNKLTLGVTNYVILTSSVNNAISTFSTSGLEVDQRIKFDNNIFGGITPHVTYYVKNILSATTFTISDSIGGTEVALTTVKGNATFITEDYAVTLADDQVAAKMILAEVFNENTDYISYVFFGETTPQYGFTVPQTQVFNGDYTVGPYYIPNLYLGGTNPENSIVEINGLRIEPSEYLINPSTNTVTFNSIAPTLSDFIAVTAYNDTQRQYLSTNSYTNKQVSSIVYVNNNISINGTVQVTTSTPHGLATNDVVRIGEVVGSTQLNNGLFIIDVDSPTTFLIYYFTNQTVFSTIDAVLGISAYVSGGKTWKYQSYMLENTKASNNDTTYITVLDTSQLVVDTPIYFSEEGITTGYPLNSIPELVAGQMYYIKQIDVPNNKFSISDTQNGYVMELTPNLGTYSVRVCQWEQDNVDRLYITINGERVNPENLRTYPNNEIGILIDINLTDVVLITSMIPSATPNSETYIQIISENNEGTVYRANTDTKTYLIESVEEFSTRIYVKDVTSLVKTKAQENTAPAVTNGYYFIGLDVQKDEVISISVYNNNIAREGYIEQELVSFVTTGLGPFVKIKEGSWIEPGDILTITTTIGRFIYINGEYMTVTNVDFDVNMVTVLRGQLNSSRLVYIPKGNIVYGLLNRNIMTQTNYNLTWNPIPGVYNIVEGDPLQIADTNAARFLRTVVK